MLSCPFSGRVPVASGASWARAAATAGTPAAIASASPTCEWNNSTFRIRSSVAGRINPAWIAAVRAPRAAFDPSPSSRSAAGSSGARMSALGSCGWWSGR
ncbi:hypothetical protein [Streptomyces sp. NPDC056323]|uniref:hypothetical protein n=1 Tax=Streptomyces sp. NPDC056323 TaxID=3345784 RepID=UPI0035D53FBA